ncbi:protein of unknown function [Xenorhabdus doucetiae]|uniref:Uncharacterized protein n=1 Tax=Xenorhabdus doucetiae TaxID=351671 RepID=A0A068QPG1_9GAMM|nr:protein of unknown function [Xenorhabdus doucetiae]
MLFKIESLPFSSVMKSKSIYKNIPVTALFPYFLTSIRTRWILIFYSGHWQSIFSEKGNHKINMRASSQEDSLYRLSQEIT